MDYILADRTVIRKSEEKYFTEKVCYFPKCYIPSSNDITLKVSNNIFTRSKFNLPDNETVFCAFHNPHKINPEIFNTWVNILKKFESKQKKFEDKLNEFENIVNDLIEKNLLKY